MILAIESSGQVASSAVIDKTGEIVCENMVNRGLFHSQILMPLIIDLLNKAQISCSSLNLISVAIGPGSFTGLRIGVSIAKGLALGLGIQCVGISTLRSLAQNLKGLDVIVCSVIDALNEFVYFAVFDITNEKITQILSDDVCLIDELILKLNSLNLKKSVIFVGSGADICYTRMKNNVNFKINLAGASFKLAKASGVALAAFYDRSISNLNVDFKLHYLRQSQAQRMFNKNKG